MAIYALLDPFCICPPTNSEILTIVRSFLYSYGSVGGRFGGLNLSQGSTEPVIVVLRLSTIHTPYGTCGIRVLDLHPSRRIVELT